MADEAKKVSLMDLTPIYVITFFLIIVAVGLIMLVLLHQKRQLQYLKEREQLQASFEKEILESKLEIQEQTLKNISQEIHDNIGQMLSLIKLHINTLNCNEPALQGKIKTTSDLVSNVMQSLRDLSQTMHSDTITEKGLVGAIEYECELMKRSGAFTTALTVDGDPYDLPDQKELILFRIFQEVINNVIKHAQASLIDVYVSFNPDKLILQIKDNGKGFDLNSISNHGSGIRNMKNRSQLIGATYYIESQPGKGTSIKVELPVV